MFSSLFDLIQEGGVFMIPLLLGSAVAVGVGIERLIFFSRLEQGGDAFSTRLLEHLRSGRRSEAAAWVKGLRGVVPATAAAGLEHWERGREAMETAMAARARQASRELSRFMGLLETTVTAAPLIGLLGTITGMMGVFRVVAHKLAHDPQADTTGITAGIGEALIATATGILVAVVALFIHNAFQAWAEAQMDAAERVSDELVEEYLKEQPR